MHGAALDEIHHAYAEEGARERAAAQPPRWRSEIEPIPRLRTRPRSASPAARACRRQRASCGRRAQRLAFRTAPPPARRPSPRSASPSKGAARHRGGGARGERRPIRTAGAVRERGALRAAPCRSGARRQRSCRHRRTPDLRRARGRARPSPRNEMLEPPSRSAHGAAPRGPRAALAAEREARAAEANAGAGGPRRSSAPSQAQGRRPRPTTPCRAPGAAHDGARRRSDGGRSGEVRATREPRPTSHLRALAECDERHERNARAGVSQRCERAHDEDKIEESKAAAHADEFADRRRRSYLEELAELERSYGPALTAEREGRAATRRPTPAPSRPRRSSAPPRRRARAGIARVTAARGKTPGGGRAGARRGVRGAHRVR